MAPIIAFWRGIAQVSTSTVWEGAAAFPVTAGVVVLPVTGDVAVIVFQVVDSPGGEGCCVDVFVAYGCGVAAAGFCPCVAVDSGFEAEGVDAVCYARDPGRESGRVREDLVGGAVST